MILENKVAVITGAGSGVGRATALLFAKEGAKIVVADIVVEGGEETVRQIKEYGREAIFEKVDVSQAGDAQKMVKAAVDNYGKLDILYNNAGIEGPTTLTASFSESDWDRVVSVNLKGVFLCSKYAIPQMMKQGGGVIINTASIAGLVGLSYKSAYAASKGGVVLLTKTMALEYAEKNIRINCICPGTIRTAMYYRGSHDERLKAEKVYRTPTPIRRIAEPEEIAQSALYLASDQSSFVTGTALVVDGGRTAQ